MSSVVLTLKESPTGDVLSSSVCTDLGVLNCILKNPGPCYLRCCKLRWAYGFTKETCHLFEVGLKTDPEDF